MADEGLAYVGQFHRLEDVMRRTTVVVAMLLLAVAVAALAAGRLEQGRAGVPEVLRARGFALVDDGDVGRILFSAKDGPAELTLKDEQAQPRAALLVTQEDQPHLTMWDAKSTPRLWFAMNAKEEVTLDLADRTGTMRGFAFADRSTCGVSLMSRRRESVRAGLVLGAARAPSLTIYDGKQRPAVGLIVLSDTPRAKIMQGDAALWQAP